MVNQEESDAPLEIFGVHRRESEPPTFDADIEAVLRSWPPTEQEATKARLLGRLSSETEPIVFERAVELLVEPSPLREALGLALLDGLIERAAPSSDVRAGYVAASALAGAAALLLPEDRQGRRLTMALLLRDAPSDVDTTWAQAAVQAAGTAYAHWRETTLREALLQSLQNLQSHPAAGQDAVVELAHGALLDALAAGDRATLEMHLAEAETGFASAALAEEDRVDAELMKRVVATIRAFDLGGDLNQVKANAESALEQWRERGLYANPGSVSPVARRATEALWGRLISRLPELAGLTDSPVWTRGAEAVELLVDALEAATAISGEGDVQFQAEKLVLPRIEGSFARNLGQRQMLAAVLAEEDLSEQQKAAISTLLQRAEVASEPDGETVASVLGAEVASIEEKLGSEAFEAFRRKAEPLLARRSPEARDAQWLEVFDATLTALDGAPDFSSDRRQEISNLIADLLNFLKRCIQARLDFGGGLLRYLGDPDAKENQMADHLRSHLEDSAGWTVESEVPEEGAGGRIDLKVVMGADRFVIECKRNHSSTSRTSVGQYLAQTERYLGVSLRVAALAILDLSSKDGGVAPALDNSVWVTDTPTLPDRPGSSRKIVCFVVPGNRAATPSLIGRGAAKEV